MWRGLVVCAVAACGRTGFASLPCDDAPVVVADTARDATPVQARSTLTLDKLDPTVTLTDFPLLVTLDDSRAARDLLDATASNIRFLDSGGNVIPHEIDQVGVAGVTGAPLLAWVRVPSISGLTTTLQVEIGGALPERSPLSVWNNDYEAVYHLNDATDATTHHHDGSVQGAVTLVTYPNCAIGSCQSFDGVSAFISIPDSPTFDMTTPTIEGWIYQRTGTINGMIVVSREEAAANQDFALGTAGTAYYSEVYGASGTDGRIGFGTLTVGHWTHLVMTYDSSALVLYVDGSPNGMTSVGGNAVHDPNATLIGAAMGTMNYLDGMADEVRLERLPRSGNWVSYEDASMRDNVISYGPIVR